MIGRKILRPEARPPSLRFRPPSLHIPLWLLACGWLLLTAGRGLRWLAVHPRCTVVGAVAGWLVWTDAVLPALGILGATAGALTLWWALDPATFRLWVLEPAQTRAREWFTYRRHWQPAMLTAGLTLRESWGGDLPTLRHVRSENGRDLLRVRMLPGQTLEQWQGATAALAQTFGVRSVRVRRVPDRPQELVLVAALRTSSNRHVTESTPTLEADPMPATRPAFPRAPRGAA